MWSPACSPTEWVSFWTHHSLRHLHPSVGSDFPFPISLAKTPPLSTARNVSVAVSWRELLGVRFGFQGLPCEIWVGIFHLITAGIKTKSTSGKRRLRCNNSSVSLGCIISWREWSCFVLLEFKKESFPMPPSTSNAYVEETAIKNNNAEGPKGLLMPRTGIQGRSALIYMLYFCFPLHGLYEEP